MWVLSSSAIWGILQALWRQIYLDLCVDTVFLEPLLSICEAHLMSGLLHWVIEAQCRSHDSGVSRCVCFDSQAIRYVCSQSTFWKQCLVSVSQNYAHNFKSGWYKGACRCYDSFGGSRSCCVGYAIRSMSVISDFVDTLRSLTETDVMYVLSSSMFWCMLPRPWLQWDLVLYFSTPVIEACS